MIQQGILEKVTHGGSDWMSLKRPMGILENWRQPLDMFKFVSLTEYRNRQSPTGNIKHFAKIDFKSAYNQIEIDDRFKEITILNTSMGLLRWSSLPFRNC